MDAPFLGSTSDLTRQRLRAERLRRVARDVHVLAGRADDLRVRVAGLQLAVPDAVASHGTAAQLLLLPAPRTRDLHLTRPPGAAPVRRPGVVAHVSRLDPVDVLELEGVRVTSPERVLLDLAPALALDDLVALGDVVARRVGVDALRERVRGERGRRGLVRLRAAVPHLRHGVVVLDALGCWLAAPDLADEQAPVAVQYDGLGHLEGGQRQWQSDVDRDELTRLEGWEVVVLTARDLRLPHLAVAKVAGAYARATDRPHSSVDRPGSCAPLAGGQAGRTRMTDAWWRWRRPAPRRPRLGAHGDRAPAGSLACPRREGP